MSRVPRTFIQSSLHPATVKLVLEEARTIGANAFVVETRAAAVRAANFIVFGVGRGMKVVKVNI
jgi:hypothetical protein